MQVGPLLLIYRPVVLLHSVLSLSLVRAAQKYSKASTLVNVHIPIESLVCMNELLCLFEFDDDLLSN